MIVAAATTSALLATSGGARAQASAENVAAAEALFQQAKKLMASGHFGEACPKFASSYQLDPGVGTLLNLGNCYEKNHQIASAWVTFKDVIRAARVAGQSDREREGHARAGALEPRLPQLLIQVPTDASSGVAEIKRDGSLVAKGVWGVPLPVDPGDHVIEASGPRRKPWSQHVTAVEGKTITLKIPALEEVDDPKRAELPATAPSSAVPAEGAGPDGVASVSSSPSGQRIAAYVVGGVGVVGLGIASAIALGAKSKYDGADCGDDNVCRRSGFDDRESAISSAKTATIVFGLGAVALAGGVALWLTAPTQAPRETAFAIAPSVGPGSGGVTVRGHW
jgi:hypothetical protein